MPIPGWGSLDLPRRFRRIAVLCAFAALAGCAGIDFSTLPAGTLTGRLFVMWVGEDRFVFAPDPGAPLTFHRSGASGHGRRISPGLMYTDGGSIPKIAQVFNGFSPWGYAPAYMIHDWLFVAHHCVADGRDEKRFDGARDVSFEESAVILGEAIRTLIATGQVRKDDLAPSVITNAVDSFVARDLWNRSGACAESIVSPADAAAVEAAIPGSTQFVRKTVRERNFELRLPLDVPRAKPAAPAKRVFEMSFGPDRSR